MWTLDYKLGEKTPWIETGNRYARDVDAWNHLTYLRKTGIVDYYAACVRLV